MRLMQQKSEEEKQAAWEGACILLAVVGFVLDEFWYWLWHKEDVTDVD
jgi:hypothetical protein